MRDKAQNFRILAPAGGFGNHLRWLLLLDNHFQLEIPMTLLGKFPPGIAAKFPRVLTTVESKLQFIKNNVYSQERTWHNWLSIEWYYRDFLQDAIGFYHEFDFDQFDSDTRCIAMSTDPELAYRSYLKFNSNLNNVSPEYFKKCIIRANKYTETQRRHNVLTVNSSVLYNAILDRDLYSSITQFFGLNNHYNKASEIHGLWYYLHQQAEKNFVNDVVNLYSQGNI